MILPPPAAVAERPPTRGSPSPILPPFIPQVGGGIGGSGDWGSGLARLRLCRVYPTPQPDRTNCEDGLTGEWSGHKGPTGLLGETGGVGVSNWARSFGRIRLS